MTLNLGVALIRKLLLRLNHAKIDILLVCCSDLLLLLLEKLDLLRKCKLFHCTMLDEASGHTWWSLLMRGVISDGLRR